MSGLLAPLTAAFALSLLGGVHCAGMCGGFIGALQLHRPLGVPPLAFAGAYHLGRVVAYCAAGVAVGSLGGPLFAAHVLPLQIVLLVLGSTALVLVGVSLLWPGFVMRPLEVLGARAWRLLQPLAGRLLPPRSLPGAVLAGFVWGWIPCGMVYAALPLALLAGSAAQGAVVMLAFGLGTLPNLLLLDLGLSRIGASARWRAVRGWLRPAVGCVIVLFAVSDLAHAAHLAGARNPAIGLMESLCHVAP